MDAYDYELAEASPSTVKLVNETLVKANIDPNTQPCVLPLSDFDRQAAGMQVTIFYAYQMPSVTDHSFILATIKSSLSEAMNHFYPFAGQILDHHDTGEAVILCNNAGVRLMEAAADVPLAKLDYYNFSRTTRQVLLPTDNKFLLNVQFTSYTCGGFSVSWTWEHSLADAYGFVKFLSSWCEIAKSKKLQEVIHHDRLIFHSRSPPTFGSKRIEQIYTVCNHPNGIFNSPLYSTQQHLYLVKGSSLESLVSLSSEHGERRRTRTVALSAYLWKLMARSIKNDHDRCTISWSVDGRRRVGKDEEELSNYIGNLLSLAVAEAGVEDLNEGALSHVAGIVSQSIGEVANRDYFLDYIDWLECHRLENVVPTDMLGDAERSIIVSSCHNLPLMSMDFGFGLPSVGTFCLPTDRITTSYVNMVSSGRGDGSLLVYAFVWPELAAAMDSDPEHVFEPFTLPQSAVSLFSL